jgi:hypothetical protein
MFASIWRHFNLWSSLGRPSGRRSTKPSRTPLRLETLEDRITPTLSNFSVLLTASSRFVPNTAVLTLTKTLGSQGDLIILPAAAANATPTGWEQFTIVNTNGTVGGLASFTTPTFITQIVIRLGSGNDSVILDGTTNTGIINLPGGLTITGTGGNKTISASSMNLPGSNGKLSISLTGSGAEVTTFTDVNIGGSASITHASGTTQLTLTTSGNNLNTNSPTNTWNSLTVTNGSGADTNNIYDTDFAGSVSITNGAGASNAETFTRFSDDPNGSNTTLLTVNGNLSIATTNGQTSSVVEDYNVGGKLSINAGSGASGSADYIGVSDGQLTSGPVPTFGSVSLSGGAPAKQNPGLTIDVGTGLGGGDFPANIGNGITISGTGSGSVAVRLNDLNVTGSSTISLSSSTSGDTVNILGDQVTTTYGPLAINGKGTGNNTYNLQVAQGTLNVIGALTFGLGSGADQVNVGSRTGIVDVSGNLGMTGTGGGKTLLVTGATSATQPTPATLGGINIKITGTGTESATFVDTNVTGAATVAHTGTGNTAFTIDTTLNNPNLLNDWNSLAITNGVGSDINDISDTYFSGGVTINNGAGRSGNTGQFGGSETLFHAINYQNALLNILGGLSVSTTSGQSDTEIDDYNVHGSVTVSTGAGISNMANPNFVGIANHQKNTATGPPVIGGAVSITGTTVSTLNAGFVLEMGTDGASGDFPLVLDNNLSVTVGGTGGSNMILQDVVAEYGTTTFTLGASTGTKGVGNMLEVFGTLITSAFNNFNVTSLNGINSLNTFDLQDHKGTMHIGGTMKWTFGASVDVINLAADANNDTGFSGAELDLYAIPTSLTPAISFEAKLGTNHLIYGILNAYTNTLFFYFPPTVRLFTLA